MNVYNGDVNINPDLLKALITQVTKLNDSIKDLKAECAIIKSELVDLRLNKEKQELQDVLSHLPERDLRSVYDILLNNDNKSCITHAANALIRAGVYTVEDLKLLDMKSLKSIRLLGDKSIQMIKACTEKEGLTITEKWGEQKPGIEEIVEGDNVVTLVPFNDGHIPVGSLTEVVKVHPITRYYHKFCRILPTFTCRDQKSGKSFYCSVSEIYKL